MSAADEPVSNELSVGTSLRERSDTWTTELVGGGPLNAGLGFLNVLPEISTTKSAG